MRARKLLRLGEAVSACPMVWQGVCEPAIFKALRPGQSAVSRKAPPSGAGACASRNRSEPRAVQMPTGAGNLQGAQARAVSSAQESSSTWCGRLCKPLCGLSGRDSC